MSLKEMLETYNTKNLEICAFAILLNELPEEDRKALDKALTNNFPGSVLVKFLRAEGYKTSKDSIYNHINGDCKCRLKKS
jgi:hypothetical protein